MVGIPEKISWKTYQFLQQSSRPFVRIFVANLKLRSSEDEYWWVLIRVEHSHRYKSRPISTLLSPSCWFKFWWELMRICTRWSSQFSCFCLIEGRELRKLSCEPVSLANSRHQLSFTFDQAKDCARNVELFSFIFSGCSGKNYSGLL
jgi:hypothetical protein